MGKRVAVKRTERGWAGHFICADACRFRRNTLLELGSDQIVVSTVGAMVSSDEVRKIKKSNGIEEIGYKRHYETMAFRASKQGAYIDADVTKQVDVDIKWSLKEDQTNKHCLDNLANDMHENYIAEVVHLMKTGKIRCYGDDNGQTL